MAKNIAGRKWEKPLQVKGRNCYNLTDIDTQLKGTEAKEKYTRYRAVLNALLGGNVTSKVPTIGNIKLDPKDLASLNNITKLCFGKDFVIVGRKGSLATLNLVNIETAEGMYIRDNLSNIVSAVHTAESIGVNPLSLANLYKEMCLNKEKTAPNEKKTMIDVLNFSMPNLEEVILLQDSFKVLSPATKIGEKLYAYSAMNVPEGTPNVYEQQLYMYASKIYDAEQAGLKSFAQNISTGSLKLAKLKTIAIVGGNVKPLIAGFTAKDGSLFEYLVSKGMPVVTELSRGSKPTKAEVVETAKQESLEELRNGLKQRIETLIEGMSAYLDYNRTGANFIEVANATEVSRWCNNYEIKKMAGFIAFEFERKQITDKVLGKVIKSVADSLEISPEHLRRLGMILALIPTSNIENKVFKDKDNMLNIKEGISTLTAEVKKLEALVQKLKDVLIAMHYFVLVEFMMKFGMQGLKFTAPMLAIMRDAEDVPFRYTDNIIETVNAAFIRKYEDIAATQNFPRDCFKSINPNALISVNDITQQELLARVDLIFKQFKHYLRIQ